jgi:acyl-CoA dehydrogenase
MFFNPDSPLHNPTFGTNSPRLQVEKFVEEECIPADAVYLRQIGETTQERFSSHPQIIEDLKAKAKKLGLWNMFLPKAHFKEGAGFSNLEYGLMAEYLGKSRVASEVCST